MLQLIVWSRRQFIVNTGIIAGALCTNVWPISQKAASKSFKFSIYVTLKAEHRILIVIPVPEIGQGVRTAFAQLLADEIGIDIKIIDVEQAQADPSYGGMAAAGSDSMADYVEILRLAGAEIRDRLSRAAAIHFDCEPSGIEIKSNKAISIDSAQTISIFSLAASAATLKPSSQVRPRPFADYPNVGHDLSLIDGKELVTGAAEFGMDIRLPNMCFAAIARSPVFGGHAESYDDKSARGISGVIDVFELSSIRSPGNSYASTTSGIAVLASSSWSALTARDSLEVKWGTGTNATESSEGIEQRLSLAMSVSPDTILRSQGNSAQALQQADKTLDASYQLPLLGHMCMEPMNFTAHVSEQNVQLYGPTQVPRSVQILAAKLLKRPIEQVKVNATRCGGAFGRRLAFDYAIEAILLSQRAKRPVQLVCSREDDSYNDYFRAPSVHKLSAGIDKSGQVIAWRHHIATSSLRSHIAGQPVTDPAKYDVQGAAELALSVANIEIAYSHRTIGVQCGSWRSVSHSFNTFAVNVFIDELAQKIGIDPIQLHHRLFAGKGTKTINLPFSGRRGQERTDLDRYRNVCDAVALKVNWTQRKQTEALGFAACRFKNTYCATIALAIMKNGKPKIIKITTAIDCGRVINRNGVAAQVEGAAMDGWASVFLWSQSIQKGSPQKTNFDTYPMPAIADAPEIETVIISSKQPLSGAGEPPYPAVAPAIVNALAVLTGQRHRSLPIGLSN